MATPPPFKISWPQGSLAFDRCRVMGVLNVTPDSFSDGGKFLDPDSAVTRAWQIASEGADVIDIGAQSTRPGSEEVDEKTEEERLWPVLTRLKSEKYPLPISLDSSKPAIVQKALGQKFVQIVNDVEGLRSREMVDVVKKYQAPVIVMHMFGKPRTMQQDYKYKDVIADLIEFFRARLAESGLGANVMIDPGIGFGKSVEHNLIILDRLPELSVLGFPILVGASRKSFIGKVLNLEEPANRLEGSLAAATLAAYHGAAMVRVHDVAPTVRVVQMVDAIQRCRTGDFSPIFSQAKLKST